jgi:hypothetical protein
MIFGPAGNAGPSPYVWSDMYSTTNYPNDSNRWPAFRQDVRRFLARLWRV